MTTALDDIVDLFMMLQNDYRLLSIFQTSGSTVLDNYVEPWLLFSIDDFSGICNQDLTYDSGSHIFTNNTLTQTNKNILARIMIVYWLERTVKDVLQMNYNITDRDFKHYSESQNLKEKRDLYVQEKEKISQLLSDYQWGKYNTDWINWQNQIFGQ